MKGLHQFVILSFFVIGGSHSLASDLFAQTENRRLVVGLNDKNLTGPNCFNWALYSMGFAGGLTYSSDNEIQAFLQSPLCHTVDQTQDIRKGDLGVLQKDKSWIHAFVYLSPTEVMTKNGLTAASTYQRSSFIDMLNRYDRPYEGECSECRGVHPGDSQYETCGYCLAPVKTRVFRCTSLQTIFNESLNSNEKALLILLNSVSALQHESEVMFFEPGALTRERAMALNESLIRVAQEWAMWNQRLRTSDRLTPSREWMKAALRERLKSLQTSTQDLRSLTGDTDSTNLQSVLNGWLK